MHRLAIDKSIAHLWMYHRISRAFLLVLDHKIPPHPRLQVIVRAQPHDSCWSYERVIRIV